MIDLILKAKGSIFAIGVAAITGLIRKCKEMHSKLGKHKNPFNYHAHTHTYIYRERDRERDRERERERIQREKRISV